MSRYLNFGYTALLIGGVLLAIGGLVYALTYVTPFSTEVHTTGFVAGSALRLAGQVGVLLGLTAMSVRQLERTGRTGLVVLVGLTTWMAMWIGMTFTDLFVSSAVTAAVLDGTTADARLGWGGFAAFFGVLSLIAFGIVTTRAGELPRPVGWLLIAAGVLALVPLPVNVPVTDLELGAVFAAAGLLAHRAALSEARRTTDDPRAATQGTTDAVDARSRS